LCTDTGTDDDDSEGVSHRDGGERVKITAWRS
jgi:hypothetical protein